MKVTKPIEPWNDLVGMRRTLVRDAMNGPLRSVGNRGAFEIELDLRGGAGEGDGAGPRAAVSLEEVVVLRLVDRLLERIVDGNREAVRWLARSDEPRALLGAAWAALEPARCVGYLEGTYGVKLRTGRALAYAVSERDGSLLCRHDELLDRVYEENRWAFDRALSERSSFAVDDVAGPAKPIPAAA
jgi:hypothetical protein